MLSLKLKIKTSCLIYAFFSQLIMSTYMHILYSYIWVCVYIYKHNLHTPMYTCIINHILIGKYINTAQGVYMCCKHYIYTIIQNSKFWILQYNIKALMLKINCFQVKILFVAYQITVKHYKIWLNSWVNNYVKYSSILTYINSNNQMPVNILSIHSNFQC